MARDERPLFERLGNAADVLSEVVQQYPWGTITAEMAKAAHEAASQLQREAVEAAERDQLIDDVAAFLYGRLELNCGLPMWKGQPNWNELRPDSGMRQKYRTVATSQLNMFDVRRFEAPF